MFMLKRMLKHPQLLDLKGGVVYSSKQNTDIVMKESDRHDFFNLLKESRVIVISGDVIDAVYNSVTDSAASKAYSNIENNAAFYKSKNMSVKELIDEEIMDLPASVPFKTAWFEVTARTDGEMPTFFHSVGTVPVGSIKDDGRLVAIQGMLINEISPNEFDVFALEVHQTSDGRRGLNVTIFRNATLDGETGAYSGVRRLIRLWSKAMNTGELGIQEKEEVVQLPRTKNPNKTKPYVINQVVRITTKKHKKQLTESGSREIDYSHQFEIRGHWRKIKGIGKDRSGEYVVMNHTWVKEHTRGPEDKPLVKKLRIVV